MWRTSIAVVKQTAFCMACGQNNVILSGRNFLTRAVLAAHDMEAVEKIVSDDGTGAAYGFRWVSGFT